jgi:hypothetical protein
MEVANVEGTVLDMTVQVVRMPMEVANAIVAHTIKTVIATVLRISVLQAIIMFMLLIPATATQKRTRM